LLIGNWTDIVFLRISPNVLRILTSHHTRFIWFNRRRKKWTNMRPKTSTIVCGFCKKTSFTAWPPHSSLMTCGIPIYLHKRWYCLEIISYVINNNIYQSIIMIPGIQHVKRKIKYWTHAVVMQLKVNNPILGHSTGIADQMSKLFKKKSTMITICYTLPI